MKRYLNNINWGKNVLNALIPLLMMLVIASCSKMDEYKKYTEGGEISYTGRLDSVRIYSGRDRVLITGLFLSDPKIKRCVVYWRNMADSVVIPVTRSTGVDTLRYSLENVSEGIQNFVIYTYDDIGNRSIPVYKTGRVYGERYQATLTNRGISSAATNAAGITNIAWSGMDRLSGVFASELIYTNKNDQEVTVRIPIDVNSTVINDVKPSTAINYRTMFLPDTMSVDTFYTSFVQARVYEDVSSQILKNASFPFANTVFNGRWGIPDNWTVNAAAKNWLASGVYYGGVDRNQSQRLSMEAGWTNGNLLSFNNGKIFQSPVLEPGTYIFEAVVQSASTGGTMFVVAAEGADLPDIANIPTSSLGRVQFNAAGTYRITFRLTEQKQVSLGFVGSLVGTGSTGQYFKADAIRLQYLKP